MKYAFPPDIGSLTRGIPTAFASPAFGGHLSYDPEEIYVWPYAEGSHRGISFSPLYRSVPEIALKDERLYSAWGWLMLSGLVEQERASLLRSCCEKC
jgi:hypothetical protein